LHCEEEESRAERETLLDTHRSRHRGQSRNFFSNGHFLFRYFARKRAIFCHITYEIERPRETAETLSGEEEQTLRAISAHAQCACLLSLQMGSIN
jgi:hypothetical protein